MSDARYYSITLEADDLSTSGAYRLKFSTMPGMSTVVGELHMGDLDVLASILHDRVAVADGPLVAAPRRPVAGEPCVHCGGVGSGCNCGVEYA